MSVINDNIWSDTRPYYILYQDKNFMKNIYAQLFNDYPDVGQIAYIGANTRRFSKDYSLHTDERIEKEFEKKKEEEFLKRKTGENIKKLGLAIADTNEQSEIREYANINEIKDMNNMLFFKQMLRKIAFVCKNNECSNICHINGKITMYDKYKEAEDVFINMEGCCVWLKRENMDTTAMNMSKILGNVHLIGYILEEETNENPRIIKAIAIYT